MNTGYVNIVTDDELTLIKLLARSMNNRLGYILMGLKHPDNPEIKYVHHEFNATFWSAVEMLLELGVSSASCSDTGLNPLTFQEYNNVTNQIKTYTADDYPQYFSISSGEALEERLANVQAVEFRLLSKVIEEFLDLSTSYGPMKFRCERDMVFFYEGDDLELIQSMSVNGYAKKEDNGYFWTDKIAPMMAQKWLWGEKDANLSLIDQSFVEFQASSIYDSLSKDPSKIYDVSGCSICFATAFIMKYWNGDDWKERVLSDPIMTFDEGIAITLELRKLLGED